jgi:hypothetical protein
MAVRVGREVMKDLRRATGLTSSDVVDIDDKTSSKAVLIKRPEV